MWLIQYHVVPKKDSPHFAKVGGAYVNCWILYALQDGAEVLARFEVEKEWIIIETEEISWYDPEDITEADKDWGFYSQALIDGGVFVYYNYPIGAEDADEDFDLQNSTALDQKFLDTQH